MKSTENIIKMCDNISALNTNATNEIKKVLQFINPENETDLDTLNLRQLVMLLSKSIFQANDDHRETATVIHHLYPVLNDLTLMLDLNALVYHSYIKMADEDKIVIGNTILHNGFKKDYDYTDSSKNLISDTLFTNEPDKTIYYDFKNHEVRLEDGRIINVYGYDTYLLALMYLVKTCILQIESILAGTQMHGNNDQAKSVEINDESDLKAGVLSVSEGILKHQLEKLLNK